MEHTKKLKRSILRHSRDVDDDEKEAKIDNEDISEAELSLKLNPKLHHYGKYQRK